MQSITPCDDFGMQTQVALKRSSWILKEELIKGIETTFPSHVLKQKKQNHYSFLINS